MRVYVLAVILALSLILASCAGEQGPALATTPFIGGTEGINMRFVQDAPPPEVFDGSEFPFDIVVELRNVGEFFMPREQVVVSIEGIRAEEFGVAPGFLRQNPIDDMLPRRIDSDGNIIEENPVFVEFTDLNHVNPVVGASQTFPLRASVCYKYGTIANTQLCSREDILEPRGDGVCRINEDKTVFNSGAPVQVSSLRESARATDKIGFTFKVSHVGTGRVFRESTVCDE